MLVRLNSLLVVRELPTAEEIRRLARAPQRRDLPHLNVSRSSVRVARKVGRLLGRSAQDLTRCMHG